MNYNNYASTNNNGTGKPTKDGVKISDIITMSQDISGDWLGKEAEKKIVIQEMVEQKKNRKK